MGRTNTRRNRFSFFSNVTSVILAVAVIFGAVAISPTALAGTYNGFEYSVEGGEVTIIGFSGSGDVSIPSMINGYPVTKIGVRAFLAKQITSVIIPDSVTIVEDFAFMSCPLLKRVTVGDGVTSIGLEAFMNCPSLAELVLGSNLREICDGAFACCGAIKDVVIPDNVESIGSLAFGSCSSLESVKLGSGVISIGATAFCRCPLLNQLTIDPTNESFVNIDSVLYDKSVETLVWCPTSKTEIDIPESVIKIGDGAFCYCSNITSLTIPATVTDIGFAAFEKCTSITEFVIPDSVTNVGAYALSYNSSIKSVKIGNSVTSISKNLFLKCTGLTELTIPSSVTKIEDKAFAECSSLKSITIPESVTSMGNDVFLKCSVLTDIYFGGTRSEWDAISANASVPNDTAVHCSDGMQVSFIDVTPGAFYEEAVRWAVENNITAGTSKITFSPDDGCTRGQVVTFLWRAAGCPEPETTNNPFSDVKEDDYFYKAVLWAIDGKITVGTGSYTFSPDELCTRAQIVTFLWRYEGKPVGTPGKHVFSDVKSDDYFSSAVYWAAAREITVGTSPAAFSPNDVCTRAQIVTFLFRSAN